MPYIDPEGRRRIILNHHPHRGISHDEARYPDAEKFIPERFLDVGGKLIDDNPSEFIFGFGRRKCPGRSLAYRHAASCDRDVLSFPGRYTADASVWSAISTMLATLDFNLAKDVDGNDITFKATFTHGGIRYVRLVPAGFGPCSKQFQWPSSFSLSAHTSGTSQRRSASSYSYKMKLEMVCRRLCWYGLV